MNFDELKKVKEDIDRNNKKVKKIALTAYCSVAGIGVAILVSCAIIFKTYFILSFIFPCLIGPGVITLIAGVIATAVMNKDNNKVIAEYSKAYKGEYVEKYLKEVFSDVEYHPEAGFSKEYLRKSCNAVLYDRYHSNDYMMGKYKNLNVEFADVHIEDKREDRDSDGNTRTYYVTMFQGKWMVFDFNKNFKYNLIVSGTSHIMSLQGTHHVKMEDENFNKVYSVHAMSDEEAFYILTPHMMNKMRALYHKLGDNGITFGFINNKLYVALNTYKDSFELDLSKGISDEAFKNNVLKDIKEITNFIDDLDLDNNLFK